MRVALYARISRSDKGQDLNNQLLKLREYAARQGWAIFNEYSDCASGAAPSRPMLDKMRREARGRHFDVVLVVRIDRIARSTCHLLNLCEELKQNGVDLACTDQVFDTSSSLGRMMFTVLGAVAEFELDLIRERTKDGLARARAQGKRLGRPPKTESLGKMIALKADGLSCRQISEEMGMSRSAVRQRLRRDKIQKRDQGGK
jgi:DNA invertase Pin-like site-specific DNA recombinase